MTPFPFNGGSPGAAAALGLARRWPVFPLSGKRPLTHCGLHDATRDPVTVNRWWERIWPEANVGVRTGDGLVVLDVDGNVGADSLHELERRHGELPATVTVATGGGGTHYYLATEMSIRNSAGRLGPGLDVRGDGGYVVAPPSMHPDTGRPYAFDNDPADVLVAPAPCWLLGLLQDDAAARKRTPTRAWTNLLRGIPEGQRNDSLARIVGHLLAHGIDELVALELLLAVNQSRCRPPLPEHEVTAVAESILRRHVRRAAA